ncbi:hypothetical protein COCMIDRAFT_85119, partial [Bipolaris oryzae ATCC 44560]
LQCRRKWATICRLSPQRLRGLVTDGPCRLERKSLRSIFLVRRCISSAPSLLLRCNTFLVSVGVCLYIALSSLSASIL